MPGVWYFAYGSNMESETFGGRRGITWARALAARAPGWRLVVDKPSLLRTHEGYANIVPDAGVAVLGVLYEITAADLAHVEQVTAFTLVSERRDPALLPSDRYLACLIAGAEEHGLPADYVAFLRALPSRPETAEARQLRAVIDEALEAMRPPR